MKTHLIAAEIARIVPQMAQDSAVNNEQLIKGMIERELGQTLEKISEKVLAHRGTREEAAAIVKNFCN